MCNIKFIKIRDVKTPERGTTEAAGIDFFVPNDFEPIRLEVGNKIIIPSGIKVRLPKQHAFIAFNKSGVSTKRGLIVGANVVDSDYLGELHIHLIKVSKADNIKYEVIKPGDKIVQFLLIPIALPIMTEITEEDYINLGMTERNDNAFGSTGE